MIKDARQKVMLARHFHESNAFVLLEVPVFYIGGTDGSNKTVTDVDVLILRPTERFEWEVILGDCKTKRQESPANRSLWLRGLMHQLNADAGFLVLKKESSIERDHKLFAAAMGVRIFEEDEFVEYDRATLYPYGSSHSKFVPDTQNELRALPTRFPGLTTFNNYVFGTVWNERNRLTGLRKLLGAAQSVADEIDPAKREHQALVLLAASVFAVHLADCVGQVFNNHLLPHSRHDLEDALKYLVWGGKDNYEVAVRLRRDLLQARGQEDADNAELIFPQWDAFVHIVRSMLDNPRAAFQVPVLLQSLASSHMRDQPAWEDARRQDLLGLKFALLTFSYFSKAARLPAQLRREVEPIFLQRQTTLAEKDPHDDSRQATPVSTPS